MPERRRLGATIDRLRTGPAAGTALKGEFAGLRRIRVGSYRIISEVRQQELAVLVVRVGHRGDVDRQHGSTWDDAVAT